MNLQCLPVQFFGFLERTGITEKSCQIVAAVCQIRQIGIRTLLGEVTVNLQCLPVQFFGFLERADIEEKNCQIVAAVCQIKLIDIRIFPGEIPVYF